MPLPNRENFGQHIQDITEEYYLQPFTGPKKTKLKGSVIERQVHGAMHASRATVWTLFMHQVLQKLVPDYVNNALDTIAKHIGTDEASIIRLILLTIFCHDSARKGEGPDLWDKESGDNCHRLLMEYGLDNQAAAIFSQTITFKDNPAAYAKLLKELGIADQDIPAFEYIRTIVNLGDNLDIVRTTARFSVAFVYKTLSAVPGFDLEKHVLEIDAIILSVQRFVHNQHDMICGNSVIKDGHALCVRNRNFSLAEKLKLEHSDNVFLRTYEAVLLDDSFKALMSADYFTQAPELTTEETEFSQSEPELVEPDPKKAPQLKTPPMLQNAAELSFGTRFKNDIRSLPFIGESLYVLLANGTVSVKAMFSTLLLPFIALGVLISYPVRALLRSSEKGTTAEEEQEERSVSTTDKTDTQGNRGILTARNNHLFPGEPVKKHHGAKTTYSTTDLRP